ncbi:hypothetical protein [Streptomyces sp. NPDC051677]|uniref:hypothetical protein n=1 Tax=Streptomyces sp. NPDC051677 TaxID=3365669 RepID=UPI0037D2E534
MTAILPDFVNQLLDQSQDPAEIPKIGPSAAIGWLAPLASRILSVFDTGSYRADGSFLAHSYVHLPLSLPEGPTAYLRMTAKSGMEPWPVLATSVVLTIAGSLELEMYQEAADSLAQQPHYARTCGPEEVFAVHADTLCATRSSAHALHLLAIAPSAKPGGSPLNPDEYTRGAHRAREILESVSLNATAGGRR